MSWFRWKYFAPSRYLHTSVVKWEKDVSTREPVDEAARDINAVPLRKIDKRMFVFSGKYKRIEDVPDRASRSAVAHAQSICRIKICNYMMVAVVIAAVFYIMKGKKLAAKGETIGKRNEERHKEYNRRYEEEQQKKLSS